MSDDLSFQELIHRVRHGDEAAAAELVQRYEPAVRRAVRFRLVDTRLRSVLDSMDVCQSVMASFFVRAAAGQYELDRPAQLVNLLIAMAQNKVASLARKEQAQRRDNRRAQTIDRHAEELVASGAGPGQQAATKELLHEVYRRLSPEERELVDLRNQGSDWQAIATQLGDSSVVLRKRLSRALDRISQQLGLE